MIFGLDMRLLGRRRKRKNNGKKKSNRIRRFALELLGLGPPRGVGEFSTGLGAKQIPGISSLDPTSRNKESKAKAGQKHKQILRLRRRMTTKKEQQQQQQENQKQVTLSLFQCFQLV